VPRVVVLMCVVCVAGCAGALVTRLAVPAPPLGSTPSPTHQMAPAPPSPHCPLSWHAHAHADTAPAPTPMHSRARPPARTPALGARTAPGCWAASRASSSTQPGGSQPDCRRRRLLRAPLTRL
jgi:hypothetical protein